MDPHFIFNVINSIQYFIQKGDKEIANNYLSDFAKLIRLCSGFSGKSKVLLEEEIAYLHLYLLFENLRFGESLTYEININPNIDIHSTHIEVMMIQPFLENAIWHGIMPLKSNGYILTEIDKHSDNLLKIRVTDNGVGIESSFIDNTFKTKPLENHTHCIALQRLKILEITIGQELFMGYHHLHPAEKNKGTVVEFLLPVVYQ